MQRKKKRINKHVQVSIANPFKTLKEIDYKDVYKLKKLVTTRGRLVESARTGMSKAFQRKLAREVKKARFMSLLPYNQYT